MLSWWNPLCSAKSILPNRNDALSLVLITCFLMLMGRKLCVHNVTPYQRQDGITVNHVESNLRACVSMALITSTWKQSHIHTQSTDYQINTLKGHGMVRQLPRSQSHHQTIDIIISNNHVVNLCEKVICGCKQAYGRIGISEGRMRITRNLSKRVRQEEQNTG